MDLLGRVCGFGVIEAIACGFEQGGVGGVFAELPGHDAAEVLRHGKVGLVADRDWVLVGPKGVSVVEPWRVRARVSVEHEGPG